MTTRSIQVSWRWAASTPSGTATTTAIRMVKNASDSVGSIRSPTSAATVFLKKKLSPRSPRNDLADPDHELLQHRLVEAELPANLRHLLGIGVVAGDDRRGIGRRQPQHQEDEYRDDQHHRNGLQETSENVAEHVHGKRPRLNPGQVFPARGIVTSLTW